MKTIRMLSASVVLVIVSSPATFGGQYVVTVTSDSNDGVCDTHCSLREAIRAANNQLGKDSVFVPAGTYNLSIPGTGDSLGETGDLDLWGDVDIIGAGPKKTIIDANRIDRVIQAHGTGYTYLIRGLTLRGGGHVNQGGQGGGGFWLWGESLATLDSVHLIDNQVGDGPTLEGGGVLATDGILIMTNCLVKGNQAKNGAGIAIKSTEGASIHSSTITDNHSVANAGGLYSSATEIDVVNTTITGNSGGGAIIGGIYNNGESMVLHSCTLKGNSPDDLYVSSTSSTAVTMVNTVVDGTCSGDVSNLSTGGGNLESPGNTCDLDPVTDRPNVALVRLESLAYCGGPTPTHRPLVASPALDMTKAQPACRSMDQRGVQRPRDGDGDGLVHCDGGAVERVRGELFIEGFESGYSTAWTVSEL